jgi:chromosomal replication initiation ATPase DnaA
MMARQLTFELPLRAASGRDAFFVAAPNALAVAEIDRWRDWPARKLALVGPKGAGKSHLAAVWAAEADATILPAAALAEEGAPPPNGHMVIEGAEALAGDPVAEERLLHVHNAVLERGGRLLLTSRVPPARWPVALPDLASRLAATPVARLEPPDDALLAAVLVKLIEDRQLTVPPDVLEWVLPRMERSFAAAQALVAALDARALATGRPIGRKLASEVLDAANRAGQNGDG